MPSEFTWWQNYQIVAALLVGIGLVGFLTRRDGGLSCAFEVLLASCLLN